MLRMPPWAPIVACVSLMGCAQPGVAVGMTPSATEMIESDTERGPKESVSDVLIHATLPALSLSEDAVVWGEQVENGSRLYRRSKAAAALGVP